MDVSDCCVSLLESSYSVIADTLLLGFMPCRNCALSTLLTIAPCADETYSYSNCLLASLNFRLVLRSQSDPNLTAIVWNDLGSNMQSSQPGRQPSQAIKSPVRAELDTDIAIGPNEVRPCIKFRLLSDSCGSCRPDRKRIVLSRLRHVKFVDSFSQKH